MATSGRVNTNTIYTGTTYWYIETYWWVTGWGTGNNANLANIEWTAYLRRSSGSKTQVQSYDVGGNVNDHPWQVQSGTMYKDQILGSGTFQQWGSYPVKVVVSGHIYGSGSSYYVSANQTWTLDNNITTPSCSCSITSISENSISASLTVTNSGNASITENVLQIYTDSGYTTKAKSDINGTSGTWTGLSLNTQYYVRARVKNAGNIYSSYSTPTTQPHTWNKPTIKSIAVANLTAGNSQTVTLNNDHNRSCTIKVLKDSTILYSGTTSGTTLTFTIPADKCRTALGTGSSSTTEVPIQYSCVYSSWSDTTAANAYKLKNNTAYKPTWNSNFTIDDIILYGDQVTSVVDITGDNHILVQGKSNWSGAADFYLQGGSAAIPNGNSGSSIEKYEVIVDQEDPIYVNPGNIDTIPGGAVATGVSTISIKIKAIDYKGVSSDVRTKTIITTPYAVPTGTITAKRQNNYGTTVELTINPTWAVSSRNAGTATWSYKLSTDSSWTTPGGTLNPINRFNTPVALGVSFDNALSYEFKVVLTDAFGGSSTAEIKTSVGPGMPIFFIDETVNGVGVNTIPTQQGLFVDGIIKGYDGADIDGDTYLNDDTYVGNNLDVTGTTSTNTLSVATDATVSRNLKVSNTINNTFYISVGNTNNYPYHRIAYTPARTGNYIDNSIVLLITAGYNGGPFGIVKCDFRTNNASGGATASAAAVWLARKGFSVGQVVLGLKNTAANSYLDIFIKTSGGYNSMSITPLFVGKRGAFDSSSYTLCNSTEVNDTTTSDKKTSVEAYASITTSTSQPRAYTNVITATDGATTNNGILETVYPVGSIYMSVNSTSPASLFGGTWEALKNRFLVGAGDTYAVNATGGATTHTHPLSANGHADITYYWTGSRNRLVLRTTSYTFTGGRYTDNDVSYVDGSHSSGGTATALSGNTDSGSTLPPYLAIYMWKRTA